MTNLRLSRQREGMVSAGRHPHHLLVVQTLDAERLQSAKTHNTLLVYIRVNDMLCKHRREFIVKTTAKKKKKNIQPKNLYQRTTDIFKTDTW